jgi:hypothetical protein
MPGRDVTYFILKPRRKQRCEYLELNLAGAIGATSRAANQKSNGLGNL